MQRLRDGQCNKGSEQDTSRQNGERHPDKVADQAVARSNTHFTNSMTVV